MGSAGIAAIIGHLAFWVLLIVGFASGELRMKHGVVFLALWLAGRFGLPYLPSGGMLFPPFIAVLDIVLVLMVFKGDVGLR